MLPLKGTRILDLTVLSGFCGMELADYGAEVIKIETPQGGDTLRNFGPMKNGASAYHAFRDRGKKSITLNLWTEEGQKIYKDLVLSADVIIENFKPGTLEALGIGYDDISAIKPSIVYARTTAYGYDCSQEVAQSELVTQAKMGAMHVTGFAENPPTRIGFQIAQKYNASFLSSGICLALLHARQTGEGQIVETALCSSLIAITEDKVITHGITGEDPMRTGNAHPLINPYDIIKCKNGYVAMGISSDDMWKKFCMVFEREDWITDERYNTNVTRGANYFGDLRNQIAEMFENYTMEEVAEMCDSVLIPGTMCSTTKEALEQPQLQVRNMIVTVNDEELGEFVMPGRPVKFVGETEEGFVSAPRLGADNAEIYASLNLDTAKLDELKKSGVI